jgi:adenylate cyclase
MADPEVERASALERENRILQRRLHRLQANVRELEELQDSNSTLLSALLRDLEEERAKSQRLLRNVLPEGIVGRLESGEAPIADRHDDVTVLFGDFVDFTRISATLPPAELVEELNELFRGFDQICDDLSVEKIKTVGDAYLAVGGLGAGDGAAAPARAAAEAALRMLRLVDEHPHARAAWRLRIGLHSGPIVAGVVGSSKFAYDIWGDTVNVASRLQSTSEPGRIHVSSELASRLGDAFALEPRGAIALKGLSDVETFYLTGRR